MKQEELTRPHIPEGAKEFRRQERKRKFWAIVHNLIAHPLLITGKKWADRFHDWTAERM